ncbi:hypothetical protein D3C76_1353200 [compost metagenome]
MGVEGGQRVLGHAERTDVAQGAVHIQRGGHRRLDPGQGAPDAGDTGTDLLDVGFALGGQIVEALGHLGQGRRDLIGQAQDEVQAAGSVRAHGSVTVESS